MSHTSVGPLVGKRCRNVYPYKAEKRVDTRLVAELIHYAAVNAFDIAVLASGDQDFVPAVEAVGALGKRVMVGVWPRHGLSRELRVRCFGQVNFADGIREFQTGRPRGRLAAVLPPLVASAGVVTPPAPAVTAITVAVAAEVRTPPTDDIPTPATEMAPGITPLEEALLNELRDAASYLPHVSRWYFENMWRSHQLPDPARRNQLVEGLIASGRIVTYEFTDRKGRPTEGLRLP